LSIRARFDTLPLRMPSLLQVLHDATGYGANEIVLEPDRPPTLRTPVGIETLGASLSESDLFDALTGVLAPDQQAELAMGSLVEFQLHDGLVRWQLTAQAGVQGVVVRGRPAGSGSNVAERGTPLELPPLPSSIPESPSATPQPVRRRDTAWDLPSVVAVATPSATPDWLVEATPPTVVQSREVEPDFAFRRRPPTGEPPARLEDALDLEGVPVDDRGRDPFVEIAKCCVDGTLCLVRGHGVGERIARHLGAYALVVEAAEVLGRRLDPAVAVFVIRLEDPSELLGWMLRRVEEGARVLVEVAARTPDGGRRVLLGVGHDATAIAWIDAVPLLWVSDDAGQYRVRTYEGP
jgi:hypothetical protein